MSALLKPEQSPNNPSPLAQAQELLQIVEMVLNQAGSVADLPISGLKLTISQARSLLFRAESTTSVMTPVSASTRRRTSTAELSQVANQVRSATSRPAETLTEPAGGVSTGVLKSASSDEEIEEYDDSELDDLPVAFSSAARLARRLRPMPGAEENVRDLFADAFGEETASSISK